MPLLYVILWIAVIGVVVWALATYIPMPDPIKKLLVIVAVVGIVLWLVSMFAPGGGPWIGRHP